MSHETLNIEELARELSRDRREIEKLVLRGRIPGRKVGGEWQFNQLEITHWLEQEMREYTAKQLQVVEEAQEHSEADNESPVASLLRPETVQIPLSGRTKRSVLENLIEVAGRTWQVWEPSAVLKAVQQREEVMSTAHAGGIAIPHPRNPMPDALGESVVAFGRHPGGIPFGAPNGGLTDLFFLILARDTRTHLQILARLGRMLQQPGFLENLRHVESSQYAYELICEADRAISASA